MSASVRFFGALLLAAPLFSQTPAAADPSLRDGVVQWFQLNESWDQVGSKIGQPKLVADFGVDFKSWQYQIGAVDEHEFSHQLVFRKSTRQLISITRNYEPQENVDRFFSERDTTVHHFPDAKEPQFSIRLRRLSNGRVLMAMGISKPGQPTGQLVLMLESELRNFYPWLFRQLDSSRP